MSSRADDQFIFLQNQTYVLRHLLSTPASSLYEAQDDLAYGHRLVTNYPRFFKEGLPLRLVVNRAGLGHAFWYMGRLCVSVPLRDAINACCRVRFVPATISKAFCLPIDLIGEGGLLEEDRCRYGRGDGEEDEWEQHWLTRVAKKYECDPPQLAYYELVAATPHDLGIDHETLPSYAPCPARNATDVRTSRRLLSEFGLFYFGGYTMRVDVWDHIMPFLNMPLFDVMRVTFAESDTA